MKFCKTCNIKYKNDISNCLICNDILIEINNDYVNNYPTYIKENMFKKYFYNIFLILNIISIVTTLFIDYSYNNSFFFSLIVSVSNIYLIVFLKLLFNNKSYVIKSFQLTFINVVYLITLGHILNDITWAIDIVFPSLLILNTIILLITTFVKSKNWQKYAIFLLISVLSNILIIILNVLNITTIKIFINISFLFGLLVIISLLIFTPKNIKEEIKRRLHL